MIRIHMLLIYAIGWMLVAGLAGCQRDAEQPASESTHQHDEHDHAEHAEHEDHDDHDDADASTLAIPPNVVKNLGLTFIKAERRPVRATKRLPGQFELRPEARREYHVMLPGRVALLVKQYQTVAKGEPLFHLDSPEWEKIKRELAEAFNVMRRSHADLAVAEASLDEARSAVEIMETRIAGLAEAQVRQANLEADLADRRNTLPRMKAELQAAHVEFEAAHTRYDVMLRTAASVSGIAYEKLGGVDSDHAHLSGEPPAWQAVSRLTFHAEAAGIVNEFGVTNQGWAETGDLVLDTVNPKALRFHADALQTDITLFQDGQAARIAPTLGGSIPLQDTTDGEIRVAFQAHAEQRIIPIYLEPTRLPTWAKAGVAAYLEVFLDEAETPVVAIPRSSIIRDGLEHVFFRLNPENPNEVIRTQAFTGADDGRWVEIEEGLAAGEQVVLGGVYPLMLAGSTDSASKQGGHMHADGTFHQGKDE